MAAKAFSRWQASAIHLLISVAIAAAVVALMLGIWYPGPLFEAAGGTGLLMILVGVDVVLGPLLTLIVFRSGKRGMKLDLAMIGLVQSAALVYGAHVVFLARPAFIVFVQDRFELAIAAELDAEALAEARYPQFRAAPWTGPLLAVAEIPTDPVEREKVFSAALAGRDLQHLPKLFAPYDERRRVVLSRAQPIPLLRATSKTAAKVVEDYLAEAGIAQNDVLWLLLRTRFAWITVLVDARTGAPVKMLLAEKILDGAGPAGVTAQSGPRSAARS
jgi:hypothetical protein